MSYYKSKQVKGTFVLAVTVQGKVVNERYDNIVEAVTQLKSAVNPIKLIMDTDPVVTLWETLK